MITSREKSNGGRASNKRQRRQSMASNGANDTVVAAKDASSQPQNSVQMDPNCAFCQGTTEKGQHGSPEVLLGCAECGSSGELSTRAKTESRILQACMSEQSRHRRATRLTCSTPRRCAGHPSCMRWGRNTRKVAVAQEYDWRCMECKTCEICKGNDVSVRCVSERERERQSADQVRAHTPRMRSCSAIDATEAGTCTALIHPSPSLRKVSSGASRFLCLVLTSTKRTPPQVNGSAQLASNSAITFRVCSRTA